MRQILTSHDEVITMIPIYDEDEYGNTLQTWSHIDVE